MTNIWIGKNLMKLTPLSLGGGILKPGMTISAVSVIVVLGCATPSQVSADAEVNRLCAIDGGIRVYERVSLSVERFDKYGNVGLRNFQYAKPTDEYYFKSENSYLRNTDPYIIRTVTRVIRRDDGKVLGESIRYGRGGGDIPGPWHPSTFSCPEIGEAEGKLEASIFLQGEKK